MAKSITKGLTKVNIYGKLLVLIGKEVIHLVEKKVNMTFKIEPSLKRRAEALAEKKGISLAALIRELLIQAEKDEFEDPLEEVKRRLELLEKEVFGKK